MCRDWQFTHLQAKSLVERLIRVTGLVQGVGFRPFVWHLAHELQLVGWVRNDALGVEIAAQGSTSQLDALLQRLRTDAPVQARVDAVHAQDVPVQAWTDFVIQNSLNGPAATAIGADMAVCADCLKELLTLATDVGDMLSSPVRTVVRATPSHAHCLMTGRKPAGRHFPCARRVQQNIKRLLTDVFMQKPFVAQTVALV